MSIASRGYDGNQFPQMTRTFLESLPKVRRSRPLVLCWWLETRKHSAELILWRAWQESKQYINSSVTFWRISGVFIEFRYLYEHLLSSPTPVLNKRWWTIAGCCAFSFLIQTYYITWIFVEIFDGNAQCREHSPFLHSLRGAVPCALRPNNSFPRQDRSLSEPFWICWLAYASVLTTCILVQHESSDAGTGFRSLDPPQAPKTHGCSTLL